MIKKNITVEFCSFFTNLITQDNFYMLLNENKFFFSFIIPELKDMIGFNQNNPHHEFDVFGHTVHALKSCDSKDYIVRMAVFFHDFGKPHSYQDVKDNIRHFSGHGRVSADLTRLIMKRLGFDNNTITLVFTLVSYHDATFIPKEKYINRWLKKIGKEQLIRLLTLRKSDIMGQKSSFNQDEVQKITTMLKMTDDIPQHEKRLSTKDLAISGKDLLEAGYMPGKQIGDILRFLLDEVLKNKVQNSKNELLSLVKKI